MTAAGAQRSDLWQGDASMSRRRAVEGFASIIEEHYSALRRIAERSLSGRRGVDRMSPSSLVAESVIRLLQQRSPPQSEGHLRGLATVFMARVLADDAKSRMRIKRGGGAKAQRIDDASVAPEAGRTDVELGDGSVDRDGLIAAMLVVAQAHPRAMEVVTLHLVGGIELSRTAELIGISERTAYRDLEIGRAELARQIETRSLRDGPA